MSAILDSCSLEEIEKFVKEQNWPHFRSKQLYSWIFGKYVSNFSDMTNLSKEIRETLSKVASFSEIQMIKEQISKEENTTKWLFKLSDQAQIETVLMKHHFGNSLCISTQAGCSMGCSFCASTLNGLERNLTAGELFGQVRFAQKVLMENQEKLDNLILMGTGEPFQNISNVLTFLKNLHHPLGGDFSYRRITISTCGIIPGIEALAQENIPINLAISLHAPNDEIRNFLMPINQAYPIKDLIPAAQKYAELTGRRITYEYLLIDHINDQPEHAKELIALIKGNLASINLIPYNPVEEKSFSRSPKRNVEQFYQMIKNSRIPVSIRKEMGSDIDAACGQLRFKSLQDEGV